MFSGASRSLPLLFPLLEVPHHVSGTHPLSSAEPAALSPSVQPHSTGLCGHHHSRHPSSPLSVYISAPFPGLSSGPRADPGHIHFCALATWYSTHTL